MPVSLPGPWGQDSPRPPLPRPAPPSPAAAGRPAGGQGGARQLPPTARLRQALERSALFMMCMYMVEIGVRKKYMITSQNINYEVTPIFSLNTEKKLSSVNSVQFSSVQKCSIQFSLVRGSVQISSAQFSSVRFGSVRFGSVQFSSVQFRSVQFSSVQFSSVHLNFCQKM